MKKIKILTVTGLAILCCSCYKNPVERNTIVFIDSVANVQDSLLQMMDLLEIMPKSTTVLNTNYYYKGETLYINNSVVGNPDNISIDTVSAFKNFNSDQRKVFIKLSKYLKKNYIDSAYEENKKSWFFIYRSLPDGDFNEVRDIVVVRSQEDSILLKKESKILDKKDRIFLIAPKEAIIR